MNHPLRTMVASHNPVKLEAARQGLWAMFPGLDWAPEGLSVPSGVREQPMTDAETRRGAWNRARNAQAAQPEADLWLGIEGGLDPQYDQRWAMAWVVVLGRKTTGEARSCSFPLPPAVIQQLDQGLELGHAIDAVYGQENSKQKGGAVGALTGGALTRTGLYVPAVILALIPFRGLVPPSP